MKRRNAGQWTTNLLRKPVIIETTNKKKKNYTQNSKTTSTAAPPTWRKLPKKELKIFETHKEAHN